MPRRKKNTKKKTTAKRKYNKKPSVSERRVFSAGFTGEELAVKVCLSPNGLVLIEQQGEEGNSVGFLGRNIDSVVAMLHAVQKAK